jgi:hypothetical protein
VTPLDLAQGPQAAPGQGAPKILELRNVAGPEVREILRLSIAHVSPLFMPPFYPFINSLAKDRAIGPVFLKGDHADFVFNLGRNPEDHLDHPAYEFLFPFHVT